MEISAQELKVRLEKGEKINLIDVREEWEFDELRIDGSINIPLYSIPDNFEKFGDKNDEIILHCRTGVRGNTARAVLNQEGFTDVKNLTGGIVAYFE